MIARIWRGITPQSKSNEYLEFLGKTGIPDYLGTEGNRGVYVLRRNRDGHSEFLLLSLWDSFDAIRKFSGPDIEKAVYYPEDPAFLIELEPNVAHYEVMVSPK